MEVLGGRKGLCKETGECIESLVPLGPWATVGGDSVSGSPFSSEAPSK